jgi:voltage-gated potassium channel
MGSLHIGTNFGKQIKILIALIMGILLIGVVGFSFTEGVGPTGAFMLTLESISFKHRELIGGQALDLFLKAVGVIVIWFSIWTAFGLAVEGKFEEYFKEAKLMNQINKVENHYIVCGAGRVGKNVGARLKQRKENVVFIEKDTDVMDRLHAEGYLFIGAGPIDEKVLYDAGITKAKGLVASLGDDSKNLLLVLTAKEINPNIKIAVRVNNVKLLPKFKRAGADLMIIPEVIGGVRLADALLGDISTDVFSN